MVETFTAHITPFGLDRTTFVYLPDDWQTSGRRYPVIYMFDGHNLFFDSTATFGTCWGMKIKSFRFRKKMLDFEALDAYNVFCQSARGREPRR